MVLVVCGPVWLKCPGWAETTEFHSPGDPLQGQNVEEPCLTHSVPLFLSTPLGSMEISRNLHQVTAGPASAAPRVEQKEFWCEYLRGRLLDQAGNCFVCSSEAPNLCIFELCGTHGILSSARLNLDQLLCPTMDMLQGTDLGREKQLSAFSSAFLPWGIHNSLLPCCLGLALPHIPKYVKDRSGSRKQHGKRYILLCFQKFLLNFLVEKPFLKEPALHT